jgi:hypothetical protein
MEITSEDYKGLSDELQLGLTGRSCEKLKSINYENGRKNEFVKFLIKSNIS